ncbi:hypothetical protein D3C87_58530 [compost metagenome]
MIKHDDLDERHENAGCLSRNILLFITAVTLVVILAVLDVSYSLRTGESTTGNY